MPFSPALLRRVCLGAVLSAWLAVPACSYFPRPVRGLPAGEAWISMPLGRWLVEDRAEPEAMAVCRPPQCGPGLVVTVLRLRGRDARAARAVLADPQPLVRSLRAAKRNGGVRVRVQAHTLRIGADRGFTLAMERADESGKPVHGAAVGRPSRDGLHLVLVIGEDSDAVELILRRVAAEHLGS